MDVEWTATSRRALSRLSEKVGIAVIEFVYGSLADNPRRTGKPLRFEFEGLHSARRGDFRVIHRITDLVTIVAIEHRADVYRKK